MLKLKAFLVHLLISSIILSIFLGIVWFIWYPTPLLKVEGAFHIIMLLISIDLILGPTLTAIVYKKNKKGLLFDLSFIALIQIIALLYGMHTLYKERPLYIVFNVDRFTLVPASSIDINDLRNKELLTQLFDKPRYVSIKRTKEEALRQKIMDESLAGGKDYHERPEFYHTLQDHAENIVNNFRQLRLVSILKLYPDSRQQLKKLANTNQIELQDLVFYPLQGKQVDMIIILERNNLTILGILDRDPWPIEEYQAELKKAEAKNN